jgi:hypothetical protein
MFMQEIAALVLLINGIPANTASWVEVLITAFPFAMDDLLTVAPFTKESS